MYIPYTLEAGILLAFHFIYSGALADRIWNFGNSQIEYFFGLPKWANLGKAQNSQLEYFHPRRALAVRIFLTSTALRS